MTTQIDAIYEKGVFRPIRPITLPEQQMVTLTLDPESTDQVAFTMPTEKWDQFCIALDAEPTVRPEVRKLLQEPGVFDGQRNSA